MPKASALYLRAAVHYRIAHFPTPRSLKQKEAWTRNKAAFMKGASLLPSPYYEVHVPHVHGTAGEGEHYPHLSARPDTRFDFFPRFPASSKSSISMAVGRN